MQGRPPGDLTARSALIDRAIPSPSARTLDGLLGDCIDHVLDDAIGKRAKETIYDYLERNHSIAIQDIPHNSGTFFRLTHDVFGNGSRTITRCILERLSHELGWKFESIPGFEFSDYLELARARIARELVEKVRVNSHHKNQE